MITQMHFKQKGEHRIMTIAGDYGHEEVKDILKENDVPILWLGDKWHYFFSNQYHVPSKTILCHTINKKFDIVWRAMDA